MEKDQFLQHDVSASDNKRIMMLTTTYGMEGYGIYWALLEKLRVQEGYSFPMYLLKKISKHWGVSHQKLVHIIEDFGLFTIENGQFSSPGLIKRMRSLDDKRERLAANGRKGGMAKVLKIKGDMPSKAKAVQDSIVQSSIVQDSTDKSLSSTDLSSASAVAAEVCFDGKKTVPSPQWETYIDRLCGERLWMETAAMHSGLGMRFMDEFPLIAEFFKAYICSHGKEKRIDSLEEAKSYLYNLVTSRSSTARSRLLAYLDSRRPADLYRYEQRDKDGRRTYSGGIIPADAPPRPNNRSFWNEQLKAWKS